MSNYILLGCPNCSKNKTRFTHTYASYRISALDSNLKLTCKACKYVVYYRTIQGGARYSAKEHDDG